MKDEPISVPVRGPERLSAGGARTGRITEEDEMLLRRFVRKNICCKLMSAK